MNDFYKAADEAASASKQGGKAVSDKVGSIASNAKQATSDAIDNGRAYAKDAVNAAGKKLDTVMSQFDETREYVTKAINDEPVKAVIIAAVASSLLTAVLMSVMRTDDRY